MCQFRRLHALQDRLRQEQADREAGRVRVVRGGKKLLRDPDAAEEDEDED